MFPCAAFNGALSVWLCSPEPAGRTGTWEFTIETTHPDCWQERPRLRELWHSSPGCRPAVLSTRGEGSVPTEMVRGVCVGWPHMQVTLLAWSPHASSLRGRRRDGRSPCRRGVGVLWRLRTCI